MLKLGYHKKVFYPNLPS